MIKEYTVPSITDDYLFQGQSKRGFQKSSLLFQQKVKKDTTRHCNLLPTKTNIVHVKAVIIVIMQILCMNRSIPHNLRRKVQVPNLTSSEF